MLLFSFSFCPRFCSSPAVYYCKICICCKNDSYTKRKYTSRISVYKRKTLFYNLKKDRIRACTHHKRTTFLLVVWNNRFCTAIRQVSRLEDHCIGHLPSFPVIYRLQLPNYGDEFVQDLHLFPFSPKPAMKSIVWNTKWLLRHLTAIYSVFSLCLCITQHIPPSGESHLL